MPLTEIAASLYPWDLADEGIDHILDVLSSRAEVNSAYLVGLMHKEKRPLHARHYPHNPVRRYYVPEDSRAYWAPDPGKYKRIKPLTTERDFLIGRDWLDELITAARRRGMRTGCEISHTIIDAQYARENLSDVLQRDVYGNIVGAFEAVEAQRALPCLNNPDVQDYLYGLFADIAANHDVDYVQTCLVLFGAGRDDGGTHSFGPTSWQQLLAVATGGCFCDACRAKATEEGLDWDAVVHEVTHLANLSRRIGLEELHERQLLDESNYTDSALLVENEAFTAWLQFRKRSVNRLFSLFREALASAGRPVEFRYNTYMASPERAGLDFASAFTYVDSVRESDYSDQLGTAEGVATKRAKLMKCRRALREDQQLIAALGVRPNATTQTLTDSVKAAVDAGADGLSLGHYDGATMERLDAVRIGLRRWEGQERDWQALTEAPAE
jgi:hypothetical protein